tara:strand:- start:999 stop:2372 length:1374 start_codon:yes stop_codon:yes gene_type:complete
MTSRIVAVGKGDTNEIIYSDNSGVSWIGLGIIFDNKCYGVAYNENQDHWLAVGQGNNWAYYSEDGISWTGIGTSRLTRGYAVATNGNRWVVVGRGANNKNRTIVYSDNGRTGWKNIGNSRSDIFTTEALDVACNGNNWVAVGKGNNHMIAYSTDNAETWTHSLMANGSNTDTLFTTKANTVCTNGSRWIAGGKSPSSSPLGYSDDNGQTWNIVDDPVINTFSGAQFEIFGSHWDGNRFWIGGAASSVKLAYSYNGLNWTKFEDVGAYFVKARAFLSYDNVLFTAGDTLGLYSSAISIDNGNNFSPGISADELFTGAGRTIYGLARKYIPPPPPPVPYFATGVSMPRKVGVADPGLAFSLGRKALLKKVDESHKSSNTGKNIDYSSVKGIQSSNVFGKPINNNGAGLRTQRLRLTSTGVGSIKVNTENEQITFAKPDANYVNRARSRLRGSGGGGPKR